jgi:tRNA(fMet)-specific endonuclease VapC
MIYALDTNIISYMLKDNDIVYERYYDALAHGNCCVIPLMVYYEVRRGLKAVNAAVKLNAFEDVCKALDVDDLTSADMDKASDIYAARKQAGTLIDDADMLIAAQCLTRGYTLVTHNTRHFDGITDLQIIDWAE